MVTRWVEVAALLALAWAVAVPLTRWYATRSWTAAEPIGALLAGQAIGLAGGLAVLTAELTLAAVGRTGPWRDAVRATLTDPRAAGAVGLVGLALLAATAAWLVVVLITSFVRVRRSRAEHRVLLELLATPERADGGPIDVIDAATPLAYSLPRSSPRDAPHVVVSTATRSRLDPAALTAVVAHERAHLRQRHSVLVQPFIAWEHSVPFLVTATLARRRVEQLVELACDGAAGRVAGRSAVARALRAVVPAGPARDERLQRALAPTAASGQRIVTVLGAVVLVAAPPLLLLLAG